ncbi:hypothetical protein [Psittacicella hinzii]|nr:hypothetical protein [Psittacicella hinzii]
MNKKLNITSKNVNITVYNNLPDAEVQVAGDDDGNFDIFIVDQRGTKVDE